MFERFKELIGARERGGRGEDLAAGWLARERGCKILARNWRSPRDRRCEIDVVALDRGVLVFVEVKTRARRAMVSGYHAVNARKRDAVRRAILTYLACLREKPAGVRFDVIDIGLSADGRRSEIRHFENVRIFGRYWQP